MNLNHVNLVVKDVDQAVNLFTGFLGFSLITNRNSMMAVLENDTFALVLWGQVLNQEEQVPNYPKNFHIGFYQENEDAVHAVYQKLIAVEGLSFESGPKKIRDTFGFYFYFENLMIEISVNPFKQGDSDL